MTSSRKDRAIARRTFLGFAAVFTTAGVVGSITTADANARDAFDVALDNWIAAGEAADASTATWAQAQAAAQDAAAEASLVIDVTDTNLIDDAATVTNLQTALDALLSAGALTIVSPGEVTIAAAEPTPRPTPEAPQSREEQLSGADDLAAETEDLTGAAEDALVAADQLEKSVAATTAAVDAVVASAAAKGAASEVPDLASQETKDAYATAVTALSDPAAGTPSGRIAAYQQAWGAVEASHKEAQAAPQPDRSDAAADDIEPTYINGILVVNKTYRLPSWYGNGLTGETAAAFEQMRAEAASLGHELWIQSGFRSYATQVAVYNRWVSQEGVAGADRRSARPGHSEHQSGLAFDLNTISEAFGYTPEGQWVAENAHRFGFIVRFPQGKEGVTGYIWEPWHLRYLGVGVATDVYNSGLSLEEYLGVTSSYS